jgi:hypothetical protein
MLLAILMPALGKVRQLAQRIMCGTNLGGIAKAMLTYATDDEYESVPIAGGGNAKWDWGTGGNEGKCSWNWTDRNEKPPGKNIAASAATSTLSANLYLCVKYGDVSPDQFICPSGSEKKFEITKYSAIVGFVSAESAMDLWDFGSGDDKYVKAGIRGRGHNSYSYQLPLPTVYAGRNYYPVTATSNPALAVMADRNPFWDKANTANAALYVWSPGLTPPAIDATSIPFGNYIGHQKEGQNVSYADQHVKFEKMANCGIDQDNIYTTWGKPSILPTEENLKQCGSVKPGQSLTANGGPQNRDDNYLVNDWN